VNKKLTIFEVAFTDAWGGMEIQLPKYVAEYQCRGHRVYVVSSPNPSLRAELDSRNIKSFIIKPICKYLDFYTGIKLARLIRDLNTDIIHVHISRNLSTVILGKKIAGQGKIVFTNHTDTRREKKDIFHRWVYDNVDRIVTISDDMKKHHIELTAVDEKKVERIYRGIKLKDYDKSRFNKNEVIRKYGIKKKNNIIGCVGRLTSIKNQELLIRAAPEILSHFPDTLFLFVGREEKDKYGRGYKNFLVNLSEKLEVAGNVQFTGFVENIPEVTSVFDVSVLTTLKESFGNVIIEAMGLEIPVVASRAGGVPEILCDELNGMLYSPGDHRDLAVSVTKLLKNPELRKTLVINGRKKVEEDFNLEKNSNAYLDLFYSLLE